MKMIFFFLVFYSVNVFSFTSLIGFVPAEGHDVHAQITFEGLRPHNFSHISFRTIMAGNVSQDYYDAMIATSAYHCDRHRGMTHVEVAKKCRDAAHNFLKRAEDYIIKQKPLKGLHFYGKALHVFQDYVAHSNLVDLNQKERAQAINYILKDAKNIPRALKFTGWDPRPKEGEEKGLLKGDFYPHKTFAKDEANYNKESSLKLKSYSGISKFQASFNEAVKITNIVTDRFKKKFSNKVWTYIRLDKHFR